MRTLLLTLALLLTSPDVLARELDEFAKAKRQYEEATFLFEAEAYQDALEIFLESQELNPRSSTLLYIARCYRQLNQPQRALYYYNLYTPTYESEDRGSPPPADVQQEVSENIARLEAEIARRRGAKTAAQRKARRAAAPPQPAPPPAKEQADLGLKPVHWLATGVGAGVLAVGFEIAAWISFAEGDGLYTDDPAFQKHRDMVVAGHVLAGLLAIASGVSFYLWHSDRTKTRDAAAVWLAPAPGGATIGGTF